jgi:hypothetical protein
VAGDGLTGGRLIVKIVRILPDRLAVEALELMRKAHYEDSRLPALSWLLKFIPSQTIEASLAFLRMYPRAGSGVRTRSERPLFTYPLISGTRRLALPGMLSERPLPGAILTQAGLLWDDRFTITELEIFRQVMTDIRLDEYPSLRL